MLHCGLSSLTEKELSVNRIVDARTLPTKAIFPRTTLTRDLHRPRFSLAIMFPKNSERSVRSKFLPSVQKPSELPYIGRVHLEPISHKSSDFLSSRRNQQRTLSWFTSNPFRELL